MIVKNLSLSLVSLTAMLIVSSASPCLAMPEDEPKDLGTYILRFVKTLNKEINILFDAEKKGKLLRELTYFKTDLTEYLNNRTNVLSYAKQKNYQLNKNTEAQTSVNKLSEKLQNLDQRIETIAALFAGQDEHPPAQVWIEWNNSKQGQQTLVLSVLQNAISGQEVNTRKLESEAERLRRAFYKAIEKISSMQSKLRKSSS